MVNGFLPEEMIHGGCGVDRLASAEETRVDMEMWYLFLITEAGIYMAQRAVVWVVKGCLERLNLNLSFASPRRTHIFREISSALK